ncbi:MAG: hypothetical protein QNJ13_09835 [Paracoccaceae bacterium]|nr:hypothetical protein [Paracoccaceae bacterium]
MALFALLTSFAMAGGDGIACTFSGDDRADPVLTVTLEPVPSLKDRPGLYRVMMVVEGAKVRANAQPIAATVEPDVMIRAKAGAETYYTIGLREDGAAALHVAHSGAGRTLTGRCQRHEPWFPGWLHERGPR